MTYPHVMRQDLQGRKGQRCEILRTIGSQVQIKFKDGHVLIVNRAALRRAKSNDGHTEK